MSQHDRDDYLKDRYGRRARTSRSWLLPAVLLLLVGGGWLVWSANHYSRPEIRSQLISFRVIDSSKVSLRYSVTLRTATRSHECILRASDYQANVVGQVTDTLPSGSHFYTRTVIVPTRSEAASASIEHCA